VPDVFLSYSRVDRAFALRLRDALEARKQDVWIDEQDIAPASRWREELTEAIRDSNAVVLLISPDSAASPECGHELEHAAQLNKRIIPVHFRRTDPARLPEVVAARQFIPERGVFEDDFDRSFATLLAAIETDIDWVKAHTEWGRKASEWNEHSRDRSFLLSGYELDEAERWLAAQSGKRPEPTDLQRNYVLASRQRTTQRLRRTRAAVSVALVLAITLSIVALIERSTAVANQKTAQSRQLAASAESALADDPELSTLLSLRALAISPTSRVRPHCAMRSPSYRCSARCDPRLRCTARAFRRMASSC
jgi:hypothetical protein